MTIPKESSSTRRGDQTNTIGTGINKNTLLSSQKTNTHREEPATPADASSGQLPQLFTGSVTSSYQIRIPDSPDLVPTRAQTTQHRSGAGWSRDDSVRFRADSREHYAATARRSQIGGPRPASHRSSTPAMVFLPRRNTSSTCRAAAASGDIGASVSDIRSLLTYAPPSATARRASPRLDARPDSLNSTATRRQLGRPRPARPRPAPRAAWTADSSVSAPAAEQRLRGRDHLLRLVLAVQQRGQLLGQRLLRGAGERPLRGLPLQLLDLLAGPRS